MTLILSLRCIGQLGCLPVIDIADMGRWSGRVDGGMSLDEALAAAR